MKKFDKETPEIKAVDRKDDLVLYECSDSVIDENHNYNTVKKIFPNYEYDMCKTYYIGKNHEILEEGELELLEKELI